MIQQFFNCFHSLPPQLKRFALTSLYVIAAAIGIFNIQCSWTPEIETVLHDTPNGFISLQTTPALKIAPKHPVTIPESLITKILLGIQKGQEEGMLQQLLLANPPPVPAFSPSQISFLATQVSLALAKATPEEIIHFRCPAIDEGASLVQGTIAVFPPSNFLVTLKDRNESSGIPSKMQNSSQRLQSRGSLTFSHKEAVMREEDIKAFMAIPAMSEGILINYRGLASSNQNTQENQPSHHDKPVPSKENGETPIELDSLQKQLKDLRKKVDQQSEEIHRLKQTAPP